MKQKAMSPAAGWPEAVVKFWTRRKRGKCDEWSLVAGGDASGVPVAAWKSLNKEFWRRKMRGELWPLDEGDAYAVAAGEMVGAARSLDGVAYPTTYLVATAFNALRKYKARVVNRTRGEYRAVCDAARVGSGDGGEDRGDREWCDPTATAFDARQFVENLPGEHAVARALRREAEEREARRIVYGTLMQLDADAQVGLRSWIAADGVWVDAARMYDPHGSVQGYTYRFKFLWAPAFRRVCGATAEFGGAPCMS